MKLNAGVAPQLLVNPRNRQIILFIVLLRLSAHNVSKRPVTTQTSRLTTDKNHPITWPTSKQEEKKKTIETVPL